MEEAYRRTDCSQWSRPAAAPHLPLFFWFTSMVTREVLSRTTKPLEPAAVSCLASTFVRLGVFHVSILCLYFI